MKLLPTCRQVYAGELYRLRPLVLVRDYPKLRQAACDREERWAKVHNWIWMATNPRWAIWIFWHRLTGWQP